MNSVTENYLTALAKDSTIWRRRGKHGAICFIDGVIETLVAIEAISISEASKWNLAIMSSLNSPVSEFLNPDIATGVTDERDATKSFSRFLELIPIEGACAIVAGAYSVQILGIERYDSKGAVIWRVVPLAEPATKEDLSHFARFEDGPNRATATLTDDVGTSYALVGGQSGGRIERVGRFEFRPAPAPGANFLFIRWEDVAFSIALPRPGDSLS
jgi:hypothetical protein